MPNLTLVRGDKEYWLDFTVTDSEGGVVDISGSTIILKLQKYSESTLTLDKEGEIVTGTLGLCRVKIEDELVSKDGEYIAELEITWPSGKTLTCPEINIKIKKDLPR